MDRRKAQLALMARGIRVPDDDPLFLVLELNEIHFDELVARHFGSIDHHLVARIVAQVLARVAERQSPSSQLQCVGGSTAEKAAARLENVAANFAELEDRMAQVARSAASASAMATADKKLRGIAQEVSAALARFDDQAEKISASAREAVSAAHRIHASARRVEGWWLGFAALIAAALFGGMYLGHATTTGAFERVQAACLDAKEARK